MAFIIYLYPRPKGLFLQQKEVLRNGKGDYQSRVADATGESENVRTWPVKFYI